jgi:hypothetical protein
MDNKKTKPTPFRITDNARLFLKTLGSGNMNDGLKKAMIQSGFSENEKELKKIIKKIMLDQLSEM